ncbi:MAG: hypothetical protein LBE20_02765 [Deltaproteobacteria bacterium]|jgi:hypothetical protein|nr:hypothetical protein [Deltaproteobacteria bacterium]
MKKVKRNFLSGKSILLTIFALLIMASFSNYYNKQESEIRKTVGLYEFAKVSVSPALSN